MKLRTTTWAAIMYLVPTLHGAAMWVIFAFVGSTSLTAAMATVEYALLESDERSFFQYLLALPVMCLLLSGAYLSRVVRSTAGLTLLALAGVGVTVLSWTMLKTSTALTTTIACAYGLYAFAMNVRHRNAPNNSLERGR